MIVPERKVPKITAAGEKDWNLNNKSRNWHTNIPSISCTLGKSASKRHNLVDIGLSYSFASFVYEHNVSYNSLSFALIISSVEIQFRPPEATLIRGSYGGFRLIARGHSIIL